MENIELRSTLLASWCAANVIRLNLKKLIYIEDFGDNPNGARALRGKQVGNKHAVAAVKAHADHRAANLRTIVDDLRARGIASVRAVAAELNERGILTPRGGAWYPTSAARLLSRLQVCCSALQ
jgi:hypothetical protein